LNPKSINSIVAKITKMYSTNNPFELADYMNISIVKQPLGKIKGCYKFIKRNRVIFLNTDLDYMENLVVCSHELGHAIMHPKVNCRFIQNYTLFLNDKIEIEANIFCSNLLITNEILEEYKHFTYKQLSAATGIPFEIVKLRKVI